MNAAQRRESILKRLSGAEAPVSASALAALLGVSRQIVVGDVALLRAGGAQIDATPRGYQLHPAEKGYTAILACVHSTEDEMRTCIPWWTRAASWWMWPWRTACMASCAAT